MTTTFAHAVVQHSAAGYKGDPTFAAGLETRAVTKAQATAVGHAGGVLFPDYMSAEDYADAEMYDLVEGLVPMAPGKFAAVKVDGLAVYVPTTRPAGALT